MSAECLELHTDCPEETMALAHAFASVCAADDVVGLLGTLGAGKTVFVKGLAAGLGVADAQRVTSPTFVLMRSYDGRLPLHHFDAYRLRGAHDMETIGCAEVFESGGVSVIEWADHVADCLPREHFVVAITVEGSMARRLALTAAGLHTASRMPEMALALAPWQVNRSSTRKL